MLHWVQIAFSYWNRIVENKLFSKSHWVSLRIQRFTQHKLELLTKLWRFDKDLGWQYEIDWNRLLAIARYLTTSPINENNRKYLVGDNVICWTSKNNVDQMSIDAQNLCSIVWKRATLHNNGLKWLDECSNSSNSSISGQFRLASNQFTFISRFIACLSILFHI